MPTTAPRRSLTFTTLDQVMPDVDHLLERDHTTTGQWSLGQICHHLSRAFIGSVDGIPFKAPWLARTFIGPFALRHVLKTGRMPEGIKIPKFAVPRPDKDARAEAEALRAAIRAYSANTGPVAPHPFFGAIGRERWDRIHCIHCAHHLSFVLPKQTDGD